MNKGVNKMNVWMYSILAVYKMKELILAVSPNKKRYCLSTSGTKVTISGIEKMRILSVP